MGSETPTSESSASHFSPQWTVEPTPALYARFLALEGAARSYFHFPAWWARMCRDVRASIGWDEWGRATKAERNELLLAWCDVQIAERRAAECRARMTFAANARRD